MKHKIEIGNIFPTNSYGNILILEKLEKGYFLVKFEDTSFITQAHRGNIVAGKVRDHSQRNVLTKDWEDVHIELVNNSGNEFTVTRRKGPRCIVVFKDTNYMTEAYWENVVKGKVSDPYFKSFLGVGFLGEFKTVPYWKKAKQLWSNMMKRCYNENDPKGYFGKAFVDPRWHCFANFLEDIPSLPNFQSWLDFDKTGIKYSLDKDLIISGNKIYSKHACSFQPDSLNKGATSKNNYYRS